jgi:hypothetical protein
MQTLKIFQERNKAYSISCWNWIKAYVTKMYGTTNIKFKNSLTSFKTFLIYHVPKKIQLTTLCNSTYCMVHTMYQVWGQTVHTAHLLQYKRRCAAKHQQLVCTLDCQLSDFYYSNLSQMEMEVTLSCVLACELCLLLGTGMPQPEWTGHSMYMLLLLLNKNYENLSMLYGLHILCALSVCQHKLISFFYAVFMSEQE